MANVTDKVAIIRNATYGNEVREGIASGIENINTEVISTTAKQTAQEIAYNALIINAGNSNAEIVDARLGETTLKAKLQNIDSSLAQIPQETYITEKEKTVDVNVKLALKTDKTYSDTELVKKRDKAVKLNATNDFDNETKEMMTGITPITYSPIPAKKSIVPSQLAQRMVIATAVNKNMFDKTRITTGYYYTPSGVLTIASGWWVSEFIPILSSTIYSHVVGSVTLFDINKVFISQIASSTTPFTTPSNAVYGRISSTDVNLNLSQLELGSIGTVYESGLPQILKAQIKDISKAGVNFKNIIIIAKTGGDYSTIKEAITYIYTYFTVADTILNPITVLIMPGIYVESVEIVGGRSISLIGINKETCIVRDDTGDYYKAPINMSGNVKIENLTVIATHDADTMQELRSYAVHHDFAGEGKSVIKNCKLISYQASALGIGLQNNQQLEIDGVEMYSSMRQALLMHPSVTTATNQKMLVKNCVIKADYPTTISLIDSNNNGASGGSADNRDTELTFYNNIAWSTTNGKVAQVYSTTPMGTGEFGYMQLTGDSFGNNIPELNAL